MANKNYRSSTGVDEFYYGVLDETGAEIIAGGIERVEFLQTITVELPSEIVRAFGDNRTAELTTSNGNISVTSAFHKIPTEDKTVLFGLESSTDDIHSFGSDDTPPYVAVIFAKTFEDGSREWVGLTKGMFMRPNINGQTKEDGVEFQNEEITAEFMDREVDGFTKEKSVLFGYDAKGSVAKRDALFQKIFGVAHPDAAPEV
ncbi:major tail protein [Metabacillus indicus]|uniref:major tail protein n=1 Tax=Metabacillus indicus TaxID=246786 RepID=UPI002A05211C|nr:major tail protein [Metabacillus indicus]MDX8288835.1 major tail protein [Metabacillus indicus]